MGSLAALLLCVVLASSWAPLRCWLAAPLIMHDPDARGGACYVMAGGGAIWERLDAAADLVHQGRVSRVILMRDGTPGPYNYPLQRPQVRTDWFCSYLAWRGVPAGRVVLIPQTQERFGTLSEARAVAGMLPREGGALVLVSSAPHLRRALLAFRHCLPPGVPVLPYAASQFRYSYEFYHPLWLEYLKVLAYQVLCWW